MINVCLEYSIELGKCVFHYHCYRIINIHPHFTVTVTFTFTVTFTVLVRTTIVFIFIFGYVFHKQFKHIFKHINEYKFDNRQFFSVDVDIGVFYTNFIAIF